MPSSSRGEVSTTSGWPHGQRCATATSARGGRPSWRSTTSRSAAVTGRLTRRLARRGRRRRPSTRLHSPSYQGVGSAGRGRVDQRAGVALATRLAVDDDDQPVTGQHVGQPLPGLAARRTPGRPAARAAPRRSAARWSSARPSAASCDQLGPAGQVLAHGPARVSASSRTSAPSSTARPVNSGRRRARRRRAVPATAAGPPLARAAAPAPVAIEAGAHRPRRVHARRPAGARGVRRPGSRPAGPERCSCRAAAQPASRGKAAAPA